jgi:hypothetical protein
VVSIRALLKEKALNCALGIQALMILYALLDMKTPAPDLKTLGHQSLCVGRNFWRAA